MGPFGTLLGSLVLLRPLRVFWELLVAEPLLGEFGSPFGDGHQKKQISSKEEQTGRQAGRDGDRDARGLDRSSNKETG